MPERALEPDLPFLDDVGAVREPPGELHVLLGQENREPAALEGGDVLRERAHDHRREPLRRLVQQEEPRVGHQRPRDRQHLLLAAGEARAALAAELPELREEPEDALDRPPAAGPLADPQVLDHREVAEDPPVLRHKADAQARDLVGAEPAQRPSLVQDLASRHVYQPDDGLERRRLACAVPAEQRDDLPFPRREVHAVQHVAPTIVGVDLAELQHHVVHVSSPRYTAWTSGSARTSSGAPSAMTRPWCSTMMRPAIAKTTSMSCSVKSTVSVRSRAIDAVSAMSAPRSAGGMPAVASASSRSSGSVATAIASASCLRWPSAGRPAAPAARARRPPRARRGRHRPRRRRGRSSRRRPHGRRRTPYARRRPGAAAQPRRSPTTPRMPRGKASTSRIRMAPSTSCQYSVYLVATVSRSL